jgi:hypothetical protein
VVAQYKARGGTSKHVDVLGTRRARGWIHALIVVILSLVLVSGLHLRSLFRATLKGLHVNFRAKSRLICGNLVEPSVRS